MLTDFDMAAFFAEWSTLAQDDYLRFVYDFVPTIDPRKAAAGLCAEQSTVIWRRVDRQEDLRDRHGAKVIELSPSRTHPDAWRAVIAHPHRNFGARLPNLLSAAAGEGAFYAPGVATLKLQDILFPDSYLAQFDGPQFGLRGLREQLRVHDRPFFIGVVKPNLGLSPADFSELAFEAWCGGLDFCKDDEMQADTEWSPLVERVRVVTSARNRAEHATQQRKAFIANITDEVDRLPALCRAVETAGANCVMINPVWTGFSALRAVRRVSGIPIMGHFTGAAVLSRQPMFGIASALLTKLMRIAGADLIGIAGFGERMQTTPAEVLANIAACLEPLGPIAPVLPIPGGSTTVASLREIADQIGHTDFAFVVGRGVFAHAQGPRAGAQQLVEAWQKK